MPSSIKAAWMKIEGVSKLVIDKETNTIIAEATTERQIMLNTGTIY